MPPDAAAWMIRTYLSKGGRLLASDRGGWAKSFMERQLAQAQALKGGGDVWHAYDIAADLRSVSGPLQEKFRALCDELNKEPQLQKELKAWSAYSRILKMVAQAIKSDNVQQLKGAASSLKGFCESQEGTAAAKEAADILDAMERGVKAKAPPPKL
jgi:hypothetical protein